MRYGIIGSTGFLGQNLTAFLCKNGIPHIGCSRKTGVDASRPEQLVQWIKSNDITHLINLAAECGGIGLNRIAPARLWKATTEITIGVLEAARQTNVSKIVMLGTVCMYARDAPVPFREDDLMCWGVPEYSNSFYGVAKLNGLFGSWSYRDQHSLNIIYLIPVNLYGSYDNFDPTSSHVIPALIRKFYLARENNHPSVVCWGTGTATREFLYAEDAAEAIYLATERYDKSAPVNLGTGMEISIKELAEKIAKQMKFNGNIEWNSSHPDGQPRRCLDVSRARTEFGFVAKTTFDDGLAQTIEWFEKDGYKCL